MIILTTILLLFSRPKGPAVHKARPDQSGRRFVPEPSFVLPSLPRISAAWAEQAGWLRPIWWNRMRKVDHVTPANQTFPLYSCKQRSTFCCWNSWSSRRLNLLPRSPVTKDCYRSAGTSSLSLAVSCLNDREIKLLSLHHWTYKPPYCKLWWLDRALCVFSSEKTSQWVTTVRLPSSASKGAQWAPAPVSGGRHVPSQDVSCRDGVRSTAATCRL